MAPPFAIALAVALAIIGLLVVIGSLAWAASRAHPDRQREADI